MESNYSSELLYLREVLGIQSVPLPEHDRLQIQSIKRRPIFIVYSKNILTSEQSVFVSKMLTSMNVSEVQFFNQNENSVEEILKFSDQHIHTYGMSFGVTPPLTLHSDWIELPDVVELHSDADVQKREQRKKEAWSKMKLLMLKMKKEAL